MKEESPSSRVGSVKYSSPPTETFTTRYKDRVGPLADMITSDSGSYRAAAWMLPTGRPPVTGPRSDPGRPGLGAGIGPVVLGGMGAGGMAAGVRMSVADRTGQAKPVVPSVTAGIVGTRPERQSRLPGDDSFWDIGVVAIPAVISDGGRP